MRLVLATLGRTAVALALAGLVVACPTPQSPKGPPPEYEEPAAPSWLDGGGPGASADAGADAAQYIAP
jgi:hypothetical protein